MARTESPAIGLRRCGRRVLGPWSSAADRARCGMSRPLRALDTSCLSANRGDRFNGPSLLGETAGCTERATESVANRSRGSQKVPSPSEASTDDPRFRCRGAALLARCAAGADQIQALDRTPPILPMLPGTPVLVRRRRLASKRTMRRLLGDNRPVAGPCPYRRVATWSDGGRTVQPGGRDAFDRS